MPSTDGKLRAALAGLLVAVAAAAHPYGVLQKPSELLGLPLRALGIDVMMVPMTVDMAMMHDPGSALTFYRRRLELLFRSEQGPRTLALKDASFYRLRVPLVLFVEVFADGEDTAGHRHAICRELRAEFGPGNAFQIRTDSGEAVWESFGLNGWHRCP